MTTTPPPVMQNQFPLIAGKNAGIRISCTPQAKPVYDNLLRLSKSGNYWAQLIVNGIQGLASGRLHLNNVFVKEEKLAQGEFIMVLPGCVATFEKRNTGEFRLIHMTADESYFELQKQAQRPGLFSVAKQGMSWKPEFVENGRITNKEDRVVAITDRRGNDPADVVDAVVPYITNAPVSGGSRLLNKHGFDMHYTPGIGGIGGWRNLRQAKHPGNDSALHESAILLAKTMYESRNVDGVCWISEHGGSGVLIQAMQILAGQGVKLEKHSVFLSNPTTRISKAVEFGQQLGLRPLGKLSNRNPLTPAEIIGGLCWFTGYATAIKRWEHEKQYDGWKLVGDFTKETVNLKGAGAPIAAIAATTALGISTGLGSVPALIVVSTAVLKTGIKVTPTLAEAWFPRLYYKIKGKLG